MKRICSVLLLFLLCLPMAAVPSYAADRPMSGFISANGQSVVVSTDSMATVTFVVAGTFVGTMTFNSIGPDGVTPTAISFHRTDDGSNAKTLTITIPLAGVQLCGGMRAVSIIATSWTSGVAAISFSASTAQRIVQIVQSNPQNLNVSSTAPTVAAWNTALISLTAATWTQIAAPSTTRHYLSYLNLSATQVYMTATTTSSAPTGTPSSTTNSTPGILGIAYPAWQWDTPPPGCIGGYWWAYCASNAVGTEVDY